MSRTISALRKAVELNRPVKALTIQNPYPYLIVTPESELREGCSPKRCENRSKDTEHRGLLLIHSGKDLGWLDDSSWPGMPEGFWDGKVQFEDFPELTFGAIVGAAMLDTVVAKVVLESSMDLGRLNWLREHVHATGPRCWVLDDPVRFPEPIPWRGQQFMFAVPGRSLRGQVEALCGEVVA